MTKNELILTSLKNEIFEKLNFEIALLFSKKKTKEKNFFSYKSYISKRAAWGGPPPSSYTSVHNSGRCFAPQKNTTF